MNDPIRMTVEKFTLSLELSARNLDHTIAGWWSHDEELRENYRDTLEWLAERAPSYRSDAGAGPYAQRLDIAWAKITVRKFELACLVVHFASEPGQ